MKISIDTEALLAAVTPEEIESEHLKTFSKDVDSYAYDMTDNTIRAYVVMCQALERMDREQAKLQIEYLLEVSEKLNKQLTLLSASRKHPSLEDVAEEITLVEQRESFEERLAASNQYLQDRVLVTLMRKIAHRETLAAIRSSDKITSGMYNAVVCKGWKMALIPSELFEKTVSGCA